MSNQEIQAEEEKSETSSVDFWVPPLLISHTTMTKNNCWTL